MPAATTSSPRPLRALRTLALTAAVMLAACGGGGGGETPPPPPPPPPPVVLTGPLGDPVTQTVGAAGGTVEATTLGVKVRVSFPAGALAQDTTVKVTPQTPAAGDWVTVRLEPAGVFFAKPVSVVLELPAGVVPGASASLRQRLGGADTYAATTVDSTARTLTTRLLTFGGAALDVLARPAGTRSGRAFALRVKAQADPAVPADSLFSAQPNTPLADLIATIRRQVTIMENVGDFEAAFALLANIGSLLNRRGDVDFLATATPFLNEAHDAACRYLSAALADAKAARPATVAEFKPLREKAGNWWVITEKTDINSAGCPGVTLADFSDAALDLTQRELVVQRTELGKVKQQENPLKLDKLRQSARDVRIARKFKLEVEILYDAAANLDLPPLPPQDGKPAQAARARPLAVRNSGYAAIIQTELLDPLVAPAREAAWGMATSTNSLAQYPVLIDAFGPTPALQQDVQYVRTRIAVTSKDSQGTTNASATLGFDSPPALPADPVKAATLRVTPGGRLALSGNMATLECANQGAETLTVTFENVQVASVSGSGGALLAGALATLDPAALLQAAGLPPDDAGTHPLRIRRSTPCAAALGLEDDLIATVVLDFQEALRVSVVVVQSDGYASACRFDNQPFPMTLDASCPDLSSQLRLELADARTVTLSNEFVATRAQAAYTLTTFDVTFPKAGTVTLDVDPAWFKSIVPSCSALYNGSGRTAYNYVTYGTAPAIGVPVCNATPFTPTTNSTSFSVTAGQTVRFRSAQQATGSAQEEFETGNPSYISATGSGVAMTVRFVPAP